VEVTQARWRLAVAFAIVYLIWGSTYLFMRLAVETIPPLLVSGIRFVTAGVLLYLLALSVGKPEPRKVPWKGHALAGTLLTAGNASIAIAVRLIPSGVASLLVALTPCLMVVLEWYRTRLGVPKLTLLLGLALGICGTIVLVGPQGIGGAPVDPRGAAVVLVGTLAWASGSVYSRSLPYHSTTLRTSAIQMATGGSIVTLIALAHGDGSTLARNGPSTASLLSLLYLVVMGSVLGYTAYTYLLRHTSAARVSTYAFVNPVVAVVLGATFAGEPLSLRVMLAAILIVAAVVLVILGESGRKTTADSLESAKPLAVEEAP
jgi:drug/metabolite transporter (DMT)-like permease